MKLRPTSASDQGSALVAVIWLIAVIGMAAMVTLRVLKFDADLAASQIHGFRARQLAEMGVALGSNPAVKKTDPLLNQYAEESGEGFQVRLISEGGRFNINAVIFKQDENLLKEIFIGWGLTIDEAQAMVDALVDWVDSNEEVGLNGAEKAWYEEQGRLNQPFNRPFYDLEEMRLVRGMDYVEALRPDWRNWFTIWSNGALDLNEADAELIAAATGVSVEQADVIPEAVRGPDGIRDTDDDAPFQSLDQALALLGMDSASRPEISSRLTVNDATTRIESTGVTPGAKRKITVIVRNRTGRPGVLERTEEIIP